MANYALDTFTDTNGTAITAHTPDSGATAWSAASGTAAEIQSNRLEPRQGGGTSNMQPTGHTLPGANYEVSVDVIMTTVGASTNWMSAQGRWFAGGADAFEARYDAGAGQYQLIKFNGGNPTTLGTYAYALVNGESHTMMLQMNGTAITLYVDGVSRVAVTESSVTNAGTGGIRWSVTGSDYTNLIADNFKFQDVGDGVGVAMAPVPVVDYRNFPKWRLRTL